MVMLLIADLLPEPLAKVWDTFNSDTKAAYLFDALKESELEVWSPLIYYVGKAQKEDIKDSGVINRPDVLISNLGKVVWAKDHAEINISMDSSGYPFFRVKTGPYKTQAFRLHRAVACSFVPRSEEMRAFTFNHLEVNHLNGDKTDPTFTNLEWGTTSMNIKHP